MAKRKKKKSKKNNSFSSLFLKLFLVTILIVIGYLFFKRSEVTDYSKLNGLSGQILKTELHHIIRNHVSLDFETNTTARFWWDNYFKKTDWYPDGYYWDMYSDEKRSKYMGGNVQNREHAMPRSWWGYRKQYATYDANGDLHNLYPADAKANSAKSNLPLGEVGITSFDNGVSKVGFNTYPKGYRGQVFEPADEYKGDFARIYFYMVTCYQDYSNQWREDATKTMLIKGEFPSFQPWAVNMLLKWHKKDPVSLKEKNRNEEVYKLQGNRNPFIDHPELIEHIWGEKSNIPIVLDVQPSAVEDPVTAFINYFKDLFNTSFKY